MTRPRCPSCDVALRAAYHRPQGSYEVVNGVYTCPSCGSIIIGGDLDRRVHFGVSV